jgi:hypothetical protein
LFCRSIVLHQLWQLYKSALDDSDAFKTIHNLNMLFYYPLLIRYLSRRQYKLAYTKWILDVLSKMCRTLSSFALRELS